MIHIGEGSYINERFASGHYGSTIKDTDIKPRIIIGNYTSIGKELQCIMHHHDLHHTSTSPEFGSCFSKGNIVIGNDVWIGMKVTIMDNVTIGDGAIIGACAVVTKDIPPYAIAVGNPARIVKYRFAPDIIERFLKNPWWNYKKEQIIEMGIKTKTPIEFLETIESLQSKL
jgi:acetyltransferase-like isoleucine patch superfamily enzyme